MKQNIAEILKEALKLPPEERAAVAEAQAAAWPNVSLQGTAYICR